jgi:hypothetical protein
MTVTIEDIEALRRVLAELPRHQPKEVSKQEAIALLSTELGAARRRGYKPDELARILSEQGVAINTATLRGYLRRNRKSRGGHDSKAPIDHGSGTAVVPASSSTGPGARPTPASAGPPAPPNQGAAIEALPRASTTVGNQAAVAVATRSATDSPAAPNAQNTRK